MADTFTGTARLNGFFPTLTTERAKSANVIPSLVPTNKIAKVVTVTLHDPSNSTKKTLVKTLQPDGSRTITQLDTDTSSAPVVEVNKAPSLRDLLQTESTERSSDRSSDRSTEGTLEVTVGASSEGSQITSKVKDSHKIKSTEELTSKRIGTEIRVNKQLGKGAYGSVFMATDEYQNKLAVKKLPTDANGVPCLMEASIMATIIHPNINQAGRLHCDSQSFYIISELAVTDLSKYTRTDKTGYIPNMEELRYWAALLIRALACLHNQDLVHADMKASNVLLFEDNSIKLTDFTLAVKLWPETEYRHTIATCTHRAPEVWTGQVWSKPVDIWGLGCTLYEIAYGESLFPYHVDAMNGDDETLALRDKTLSSIYEWAELHPAVWGSHKKPFTNNTKTINLPERYHRPEYKEFNKFLLDMLKIEPQDRLTSQQLLNHPFLGSHRVSKVDFSIQQAKMKTMKLSERDCDKIKVLYRQYTDNSKVIAHALTLYARLHALKDLSDLIKQLTCLWIASKLITRHPVILESQPAFVILAAERSICSFLKFQLHQ